MEKYTVLELLGEGSYGKVLKCRHNDTGTLVAIKKFIETEEDYGARKVALREIRMLKKLHHPNLVCLHEVFRRKKRFHLVFEYMERSLLQELEAGGGLPEDQVRRNMYQIIRGIDYCHCHNIIHRDIKPENILISDLGLVKICDFGFARFATVTNEPFTDYVATRWYRPPELLVGDSTYGRAVDVWALGCIHIEMLTGDPLFPGNSDIDQLYLITKLLGSLTESQKLLINKYQSDKDNELAADGVLYQIKCRVKMDPIYCLRENFPDLDRRTIDFISCCLRLDPDMRLNTDQLLRHGYFTWDLFLNQYIPELQKKIQQESSRRVSMSDLPCPTATLINYTPTQTFRRNSRQCTGWTINMISDGNAKESTYSKEIHDERRTSNKSTTQETDSAQEPPPSQLNQRSRIEDFEWKDTKSPKEIPKISLDFRRNMMPNTQTYLKPVKGRLFYDKFLTIPCENSLNGKPQCEGIYLPLIKQLPEKKVDTDKMKSYLKRKKSDTKGQPKTQREDEGDARTSYISYRKSYSFLFPEV